MQNLEEFRQTYLRLCKELHAEPQDAVLHQIDVAQKSPKKAGGHSLNLSTLSLTNKTCSVVGKALGSDHCFTDIRLNDCMIPEEAIRMLAHGLGKNTMCKRLDMKGNNIRGSATEALGRLLRNNNTVLSLCLEWNAMGMLDTAFGVFCEGLTSNTSLQVLDLRNNQISHDGAAELASALKHNATLRSLDLRWNNVGLLGGRALLSALEFNKTLVKLELAGNNTPSDILQAIDAAIRHNSDRSVLVQDHHTRSQMLSREIQQVKKTRHSEMVDLLDKIDRQDEAIKKTSRSSTQRIQHLQEALQERKDQFDNLVAKMALTESELALSESKVAEMSSMLGQAREEHQAVSKAHQTELKRVREEKALGEAKLNKEIIEINERSMQRSNQVDELERKCRAQQENIYELKEQATHLQADNKMKLSQYEERLVFEKQKSKDAFRDADISKQKEVERVRRDAEEVENSLKERISRIENQRDALEQEITQQKNTTTAERLASEEMLINVKQRLKSEEDQKVKQLEDRVRLLQVSQDEANSHSSHQGSTIADLQTKNSSLILENQQLKRRIEDMQQDLADKNNQVAQEVSQVRLDLSRRIEKLEAERQTKAELYDKVTTLEKEISDKNSKHSSTVEDKQREIDLLNNTLKLRDSEIKQMRESDLQRTSMLQSALQNYVQKSPFSTNDS